MDLGKSIKHAMIALMTTTALAGAGAAVFSATPQIAQATETATISPTKARVTLNFQVKCNDDNEFLIVV